MSRSGCLICPPAETGPRITDKVIACLKAQLQNMHLSGICLDTPLLGLLYPLEPYVQPLNILPLYILLLLRLYMQLDSLFQLRNYLWLITKCRLQHLLQIPLQTIQILPTSLPRSHITQ